MREHFKNLPEDVRALWREQYGEVEPTIPEHGSFEAALLAWEAAHPDAP